MWYRVIFGSKLKLILFVTNLIIEVNNIYYQFVI